MRHVGTPWGLEKLGGGLSGEVELDRYLQL